MKEKGTRRQQIIDAAFALTGETSAWSLAEVADRIGVSKTALYRHFRNKEEIEEVMEAAFREGILEVIEGPENTADGFRRRLRAWFRENPGSIEFFVTRVFLRPDFEQTTYDWLVTRSPRVAGFHRSMADSDETERARMSAEVIKSIVSVILASVREPAIADLQDDLFETLKTGFPSLAQPADGRLDELDREADITEGELGEDNRLFAAIAASIREYGVAGTTTERIAEKMGIAKSSLYFYYPTKGAMFEELVKHQTEIIMALCTERVRGGKTLAEQLYSLMAVQANYLLLRPDILPVFNWIRFESVREKHRPGPCDREFAPMAGLFRTEDLFPGGDKNAGRRLFALAQWASVLATSAVIQGFRQRDTKEKIRAGLRLLFRSMMAGDGGIRKGDIS